MSKLNEIQDKIKQIDPATFQKLMDAYIRIKYKIDSMHSLGSMDGRNKTTKGTPDSYVPIKNGKYIFIQHGTNEYRSFDKIKQDILKCLDEVKVGIDKSKIEKIICCHTSSNITIEQNEEIRHLAKPIVIELIGIDDISNDLLLKYPFLARLFLNIDIGSYDVFDIEDFINENERLRFNVPLGTKFLFRTEELQQVKSLLQENSIVVLEGEPGVGKTKFALELAGSYKENGYETRIISNKGITYINDLLLYLEDNHKYFVILDDANLINGLDEILRILLYQNNEMKIIITVRDYAKENVKKIVELHREYISYCLNNFSSEEIRKILEENFGVTNNYYLRLIDKLAKGNARLAIMVTTRAIEKGFASLEDVRNIFVYYYNDLIEKSDSTMILTASLVAFFGRIVIDDQKVARIISEYINEDDFNTNINYLFEKEMIDI